MSNSSIIKVPRFQEQAIREACAIYGIPVNFYTDEKNEGLVRMEVGWNSPEEAWLISIETQEILMRQEAKKLTERPSESNPDLLDNWRNVFNP
jgi:hypothetical protein